MAILVVLPKVPTDGPVALPGGWQVLFEKGLGHSAKTGKL
jgi:hypothetical protein